MNLDKEIKKFDARIRREKRRQYEKITREMAKGSGKEEGKKKPEGER